MIDRQVVQSPYRIAIMPGCLRQTHSLFSPSPLAGDLRFSDLHGANCGLLWEQGFTHVCQRFARARSTVVLLPPQSFLRHARRELGVTWCGVGPRVGSERGALGHTAEASASLAPAPAHVHDRWAGSSGGSISNCTRPCEAPRVTTTASVRWLATQGFVVDDLPGFLDGMQGVRGSNPLSSTRHNATSTPALSVICQRFARKRGPWPLEHSLR